MRCDKAVHLIHLYIDHRLTVKQIRALETHLAFCESCSAELALLEEMSADLHTLRLVAEPADMQAQIMYKVALAAQKPAPSGQRVQQARQDAHSFSLFRPSLLEIMAAIVLATVATLVSLLQLPGVRALLPVAHGHDSLSQAYTQLLGFLTGMDTNTLTLALWIIGTLLGIVITLAFAGTEMRTQWFRAMMERLPVR